MKLKEKPKSEPIFRDLDKHEVFLWGEYVCVKINSEEAINLDNKEVVTFGEQSDTVPIKIEKITYSKVEYDSADVSKC